VEEELDEVTLAIELTNFRELARSGFEPIAGFMPLSRMA
jgi:hypothetical protein